MKIDRVATAAQHYKDPKSYRTLDGREVLAGEDWKARVGELRLRSGGRCEYDEPTEVHGVLLRCTCEAADPHHIKHRWPKRDDRLFNLLAVCRFHHILLDSRRQLRWTKEATA